MFHVSRCSHSMLSLLLLFLTFYRYNIIRQVTCTILDNDSLHTQFDTRHPSVFRRPSSSADDSLWVRPNYQISLDVSLKGIGVSRVSQWEMFAYTYRYENRLKLLRHDTNGANNRNSNSHKSLTSDKGSSWVRKCPIPPLGFATYADWAHTIPCIFGNASIPPKIIYVSTFILPHFVEHLLDYLENKSWAFVLVTGGADKTIPDSSLDFRFRQPLRGFENSYKSSSYFNRLLNSAQVIRWYAENRDRTDHWKFSAIPTGSEWQGGDAADPYVRSGGSSSGNSSSSSSSSNNGTALEFIPILKRPLRVMVADRVRDGQGQWKLRAHVQNICTKSPEFCVEPLEGKMQKDIVGKGFSIIYNSKDGFSSGILQKDFNAYLAGVPFIACVHGGGVDPSPKAWDAIRVGTIPIIQKLTIMEAYEHLPVAFVDNWEDLFFHKDPKAVLRAWLYVLSPFYEYDSHLRKKSLERLSSKYWLGLMHKDIENHTQIQKLPGDERAEYDKRMKAIARDHVMSVTLETANKMIAENPVLFSSR